MITMCFCLSLPQLLLLFLAFLVMSQVKGDYNYARAIRLSYKFYEAQRAGQLPDNHIPWRKSSFLHDGSDNEIDLVGGYFDDTNRCERNNWNDVDTAGDYVKFGFPMAYTTTVLAWGMIEYANVYKRPCLAAAGRAQLRWATDYFIKYSKGQILESRRSSEHIMMSFQAHPSAKKLFGQVGKGDVDHKYWGRPEDWPSNMERPSYFIDENSPGSDLAAETAAAMAASSMVFRGNDDTYADTLLRHARELYAFADEKIVRYSESIPDAQEFYPSTSCKDELTWAAAWLYRATGETSYLDDAANKYVEFELDHRPSEFSWDDKNAGVQVRAFLSCSRFDADPAVLLAVLTEEEKYKSAVEAFCSYIVDEVPRTPKGLVFISAWGVLRHAANVAYVCLVAADKLAINQEAYRNFAKQQIDYMLGDTGYSYQIGFGTNCPRRPHHASSSCPTVEACGGCECNWSYEATPNPNPNLLEGALVGGPDDQDRFTDNRTDFVTNEVTLDYNAGFQGALAGLLNARI
ncbi:unnamed protein product [Darwinula stevensoni]|uniref:Endoglucanase n=1 Tax=Darwinula stevensoni TaxID=69355 RepID=A0A7R8X7G0_9CRUS|nr:unnamed protein product [Darwinula stevensoni]CAG0886960.1 unnamed protein product [Darwinula stevensoni]